MRPAALRCRQTKPESPSPDAAFTSVARDRVARHPRHAQHGRTSVQSLDNQPSPRVEFFSGLGWIALGSAIVYGSWTMDRLENLNINPYTAPGLVPGVLGAVIALCGSIMAVRAGTFGSDRAAATCASIFNWRVALSIALCLGFALGMVGRGAPFWAAAAIFLFLHVFLFSEFDERRGQRRLWRGVLVALAVSAGASFAITMIFQEFFLVRLP
jgi:putative tricarboxylic transport membrane protein